MASFSAIAVVAVEDSNWADEGRDSRTDGGFLRAFV